MLKALENLRKTFTERYDHKPIPKKLYRPLLLVVDIVVLTAVWLLYRSQESFPWLGFAVVRRWLWILPCHNAYSAMTQDGHATRHNVQL